MLTDEQIVERLQALVQDAELSKQSSPDKASFRDKVYRALADLRHALGDAEPQLYLFTKKKFKPFLDILQKIVSTPTHCYTFSHPAIYWLIADFKDQTFFKQSIQQAPEKLQLLLSNPEYDWSRWDAWDYAAEITDKFDAAVTVEWYALALELIPITNALTQPGPRRSLMQSLPKVLHWILETVKKHVHSNASITQIANKFAELFALDQHGIEDFLRVLVGAKRPLAARTRTKHTDVDLVDQDDESVVLESRRYRNRLLLGECDFTFTEALLKKHEDGHPGLSHAVTATEYRSFEQLATNLFDTPRNLDEKFAAVTALVQRLYRLHQQGVALQFEVDATQLHKHRAATRYPRIHFNYPFAGGDLGKKPGQAGYRSETLALANALFESAAQVQRHGDRLQIAFDDPSSHWFQEYAYDITKTSQKHHYRLFKVRHFDERYPGYAPLHSNKAGVVGSSDAREFIFERQANDGEITYATNRAIRIQGNHFDYLTEETSSSYESETEPTGRTPMP